MSMENSSQPCDEIAELVGDVAESVAYLRELGVETLDAEFTFETRAEAPRRRHGAHVPPPAPRRREPPPRVGALARNARAEEANKPRAEETQRPLATRTFNPPPPIDGPSPSIPSQQAMAKKPVRPPAPDPPPPMETLFGEIKPKDELSLGRPGETFADIRADIGECVRCPLHEGRTRIVHTEGNQQARLLFVGEAPGADEDASGRPFVGRAGQLLNKIIEAIGLKREEILIGNVNRCRPPGNRTPTTEEAKTCKPFLLREIAVARPEVIVVLGNTAMKNLLDTKEGITRLRGKFQDYQGIKVMPTFHPAYLLRDPSKKRETWEDMKTVRDYLNKNKS
jgi:DNA polymerase